MSSISQSTITDHSFPGFHYHRVGLGILSALAFLAGLYMNRHGVDVEIDSSAFVTGGLRLAQGQGISQANQLGVPEPLTWFPPMMASLIAVLELLKLNIRDSFAVINAVAWGVLVGWVGWLGRRLTGGHLLGWFFSAGALLTSGAISFVCGMLYSEPPFLLFEVGVLMSLGFWWERPTYRWILIAGLFAAGALLTRYVGLTLLVIGGLTALARPQSQWGRRIAMTATFGAIAVGPMFVWHFWQTFVRHGASARSLAWHPITLSLIHDGLATLASFIIPEGLVGFPHVTIFILGLTGLLVAWALGRWVKKEGRHSWLERLATIPPLVGVSAAFMVIYSAFLVVSISIADADTPLDPRILSILVPPGVLVAVWLGRAALPDTGGLWVKLPVTGAVCGLLVLQGISTLRSEVCRTEITLPPGYISETLNAVRTIPDGEILYSDHPGLIYMAIQRPSESLPDALDNGANLVRHEDFNRQLERMKSTLAVHGGWVVYWTKLWVGDSIIPEETLRTILPVVDAEYFDDGVLLHVAPATPQPR